MDSTPEQAALQVKLDELIEEFVRAHGAQGIVTQYAMVVHIAMAPNDDGEDMSEYQTIFRGGSAYDHVALGLYHKGIEYLKAGGE